MNANPNFLDTETQINLEDLDEMIQEALFKQESLVEPSDGHETDNPDPNNVVFHRFGWKLKLVKTKTEKSNDEEYENSIVSLNLLSAPVRCGAILVSICSRKKFNKCSTSIQSCL